MVTFDGKLYATHQNHVRHLFSELSILALLKDDQLLHEPPNPLPEATLARHAPMSAIIHQVFVTYHGTTAPELTFDILDTSISIYVSQLDTMGVDSDSVLLTVTKVIKDHRALSNVDKKAFAISKREDIDFLVTKSVKAIPMMQVQENVELQPLKWILMKKTNTFNESKTRNRSRIVTASHRSAVRHSVHDNAPTVMLRTLCMPASILPTWIQLSLKISPTNNFIVSCLDVHKGFV